MSAPEQSEYIVQCVRDAGSMYEKDARAFLAEHDAHVRAQVLNEAADAAEGSANLFTDGPEGAAAAGAVEGLALRFRRMAGEEAPDARQAARNEAADWLASYPFPADTNAWAHGRTEGIAWAVSVLRNPNPTKPGVTEAGDGS